MKNTTVRISNPLELVGFIRSLGTTCMFVTMRTETEVKMNKTRVDENGVKVKNPYVGAVKVSKRNGLLNVNFVESVKRKLSELTGTPLSQTEYVAGETWYIHEQSVEGKSLALCVHKKDNSKFYLQYFPHRTIGDNTFFLNGRQLAAAEVVEMEKFIPSREQTEYKPLVITLAIDSIRELKARQISMLNNTVNKIASRLAQFKGQSVSTAPTNSTPAVK